MTGRMPHSLRSDALDNRRRILDAFRDLVATSGLDVPMRTVARRAGVGPATLYRRFPTKRHLALEALNDQIQACRNLVDAGLADPDPWRGLRLVIEHTCRLDAQGRGLAAAVRAAFPAEADVTAARDHSLTALAELTLRARDTGRLRPDTVPEDLILMLAAYRSMPATSSATHVAAARRYATLVIQAIQAPRSQQTIIEPTPAAR